VNGEVKPEDGAAAVAAYGDVLDAKVVEQGGNGFCRCESTMCVVVSFRGIYPS